MSLSRTALLLVTLIVLVAVPSVPGLAQSSAMRAPNQWAMGMTDLGTAQGLYQAGKYAEAVALLQQSMPLEPATATRKGMLSTLADCYLKMNELDKRIQTINSIIELCPEEEGLWVNQKGLDLMAQGKHAEAIPLIRTALGKLYNGAQLGAAFNSLAQCYAATGDSDKQAAASKLAPVVDLEAQGKYAEVLALTQEILQSEQDTLMRRALFFINAECTHALGQWEAKGQAWESLVALCPTEELVWRNAWAADLQAQGKWDDSAALLEQLLKRDLSKKDRKALLGTLVGCYYGTQKWDKKAAVTAELMKLCPEEYCRWVYCQADDLRLQKKYAESIPLYWKSLEGVTGGMTDPNERFWGWFWLAQACLNSDTGKPLDDALLGCKTENREYWKGITCDIGVALGMGQIDPVKGVSLLRQVAGEARNEAIGVRAQNAAAKIVLTVQSKPAEARAMYAELRSWDNPDKDAISYHLALCAHYEGNYTEALAGFQSVYENCKDAGYKEPAKFLIAECYSLLGDSVAATRAYEEFLSEFPGSSLATTSPALLAVQARRAMLDARQSTVVAQAPRTIADSNPVALALPGGTASDRANTADGGGR